MPDTYYWDSCCFISYLEADPNRVPVLQALLDEAARGDITIVTSVLSIAEVAFVAAERVALDQAQEEAIEALWDGPVRLAEFHRLAAQDARSFIREGLAAGRGLKPADAIHLATASRLGVTEVHTYDGPMSRWDGHLGPIQIKEPWVAQMPLGGI